LTQHARFRQLTEMEITFNRFKSTALLSLGYLATTCLWRKTWTVCKLKHLQHVFSDKWHATIPCKTYSRTDRTVIKWSQNLVTWLLC